MNLAVRKLSSYLYPAASQSSSASLRRSVKHRAQTSLVFCISFLIFFHLSLVYLFETRHTIRDPLYHERIALMQQHLAKTKDGKPALVVMIGTSRTGNAFHGKLMQEKLTAELGRPAVAFNMGIAGNGPIMQQIYLRRMLQQGIKPDLVLLEVLPFVFLEHGNKPIEAGLIDLTRMSDEESEIFEKYGIPRDAYRERRDAIRLNPWSETRFHILYRLRPRWLPPNLTMNWNSGCDRWGWRSVDLDPVPEETYKNALERAHFDHGRFFPGYRFGSYAVQALIDALELCRTNGIPVAIVHTPEDSNFRAWYPPETRQLIEDTFARIAREHGALWLDTKCWVPDGYFYDGHHILKSGAILFTERLTKEIRPLLSTGQ